MVCAHVRSLGGVVGRLIQPDLPLLHPVSGFHHVGLSSLLVGYFARQFKAPGRKQKPPIIFKSVPAQNGTGALPLQSGSQSISRPAQRKERGNRQVSGGRRAQKWEPSLTPHNCAFT